MAYLEPETHAPPDELVLAWQCKKWGALPDEILRQDAGLMRRLSAVDNTYEIFRQRGTAPDVLAWIEDNEEANEHYAKVKKWLMHDG